MILLIMLLSVNGITIEFVEEDGSSDIYFDPMIGGAGALLDENGDTLFAIIPTWNDWERYHDLLVETPPIRRSYYNDRYEAIGRDIDGVFYVQAELPKPPWYKTEAVKHIFFGLICGITGFGLGRV